MLWEWKDDPKLSHDDARRGGAKTRATAAWTGLAAQCEAWRAMLCGELFSSHVHLYSETTDREKTGRDVSVS